MKDRIKGLLTRKKLFRFFKIAVIVVLTTIALLSLLGTVAHASGLVDDTVNADNSPAGHRLHSVRHLQTVSAWPLLPFCWSGGRAFHSEC